MYHPFPLKNMFDPAAKIAPTKINNKYCPPIALFNIVAAQPPQNIDITNPLRNAVRNPVIAPAIPADTKSSLNKPKPIPTINTAIGKLNQLKFKNKPIIPKIKAIMVAITAKTIAPLKSSAIVSHLHNIVSVL